MLKQVVGLAAALAVGFIAGLMLDERGLTIFLSAIVVAVILTVAILAVRGEDY